ncbi:MAG: hypothetical protein K6U89_16130, partial [Chloroflexi bacterium]|nr:hypothetical protein [Chloroflexota bacterium]
MILPAIIAVGDGAMRWRLPCTLVVALGVALATPFSGLASSRGGPLVSPVLEQAPPGVCAGDEQMTFWPNGPVVGQPTTITVTSARPSTNVGIQGPWNPTFAGVPVSIHILRSRRYAVC